ncbi:hypothetical protein B9479_001974 [Cryptococcus floricola]|uniref:Uncharacterized protein n=1 Tax=Cryptococcus floricola TaxID=2591691 RepID=A0A5D3B2F1_9TREE|nr:hypothetical protein B9479_001974 [Cryptococcus floricola]
MAPTTTDEIVTHLFARPLPPLEPGTQIYDTSIISSISALDEHRFVKAALHLANDDINHCHLIAQDSDYWNSKYWYFRVRKHPVIPDISKAKSFVDACEKVKPGKDTQLREQQWEELKKIVEWMRDNAQ